MRTVRAKIMFMLTSMIGAMLLFGVVLLGDYVSKIREMNKMSQLTELTGPLSELVHELQKERGRSAGYLASGGREDLGEKLNAQRGLTDAKLAAALEAISGFDATDFSTALQERLAVIAETAQGLDATRADVTDQKLQVGQMAAWYIGFIEQTLGTFKYMGDIALDADVRSQFFSALFFMEAKERAGLERAMGNAGFASGEFKPAIYQRLVGLVGQQIAFIKEFKETATPEHIAFYEQTVQGPPVDEVNRMRQIAFAAPFSGTTEGVTSADWFPQITGKINLMKAVEDRLVSDLNALAQAKASAAWRSAVIVAVAIVAAILIAVGIGIYISRNVAGGVKQVGDAVAALADGQDKNVPGTERHDEIGDLARSMERVYQKGLEAARLRAALDGCSTMVTVVNQRREVVYLNHKFSEMMNAHGACFSELLGGGGRGVIGAKIDFLEGPIDGFVAMLDGLTSSQEVKATVGDRRLSIVMSPVMNENGSRLGTVLEWTDLTDDLTLQDSIESVVRAVGRGDFSKSVDLASADGAAAAIAGGVNGLVDVMGNFTSDFGATINAMANGDFSRTIDVDYEGKFGDLKSDANKTVTKIADIVSDIRQAAAEIDRSSSEISSGASQLSQRTESTAASLEETSASTIEVTTTVKETADQAQKARELSQSTSSIAERGKSVAAESVDAINSVEAASEKVGAIVGVIDEIAFQTNLLALNASVEAARAGEAGKGFAVVASEVRTLAQRSSDAAANIRELIASSQTQVKAGVTLAYKVGETLDEIFTSINDVASIVDQISHAAGEQATGVSEISTAISHMDDITQSNASMAQDTRRSSERLVEMAQKLAAAAAFFEGGGHTNMPRADAA